MFSSLTSLRRFKSRFPFQNVVLIQKVSSNGNYLPSSLSLSSREMSGGHDHHDTTFEPPFHRLPLQNKPLHEEHELVWSDGVAPETAIDFDAPHLSPLAGLGYWLGGLGFFYGVYLFAYSVNHPANNPAAKRELPDEAIELATAGYVKNASATAV